MSNQKIKNEHYFRFCMGGGLVVILGFFFGSLSSDLAVDPTTQESPPIARKSTHRHPENNTQATTFKKPQQRESTKQISWLTQHDYLPEEYSDKNENQLRALTQHNDKYAALGLAKLLILKHGKLTQESVLYLRTAIALGHFEVALILATKYHEENQFINAEMWLSIAEQHGIDTASLTPTLRTQNRKETELIKYAAHNAAQTELTQLTQLHDRLWEVQNAAD